MKISEKYIFIIFLLVVILYSIFFMLSASSFLSSEMSIRNDWWTSYIGSGNAQSDKRMEFFLVVLNAIFWTPIQVLISVVVALLAYKNIKILTVDSLDKNFKLQIEELEKYLSKDNGFKYTSDFTQSLSGVIQVRAQLLFSSIKDDDSLLMFRPMFISKYANKPEELIFNCEYNAEFISDYIHVILGFSPNYQTIYNDSIVKRSKIGYRLLQPLQFVEEHKSDKFIDMILDSFDANLDTGLSDPRVLCFDIINTYRFAYSKNFYDLIGLLKKYCIRYSDSYLTSDNGEVFSKILDLMSNDRLLELKFSAKQLRKMEFISNNKVQISVGKSSFLFDLKVNDIARNFNDAGIVDKIKLINNALDSGRYFDNFIFIT